LALDGKSTSLYKVFFEFYIIFELWSKNEYVKNFHNRSEWLEIFIHHKKVFNEFIAKISIEISGSEWIKEFLKYGICLFSQLLFHKPLR